jgi:hypothetical protein
MLQSCSARGKLQPTGKLPTIGFVGSDSPDLYAVLTARIPPELESDRFIEDLFAAVLAHGRNLSPKSRLCMFKSSKKTAA